MDEPSSSNPAHEKTAHAPGVRTAREQIEAARLRQRDLIAADQLPTASAEPSDCLPIEDFPGYTLLREIHRGGQGIVYQALQQSTHRKVAIKVLLEGPHASKHARQRFEREIELVASLRHPNVISVFHSDQTADGLRFCVMDYVRGLPLTRYARDNQLTLDDALRLFATVCEAVNHAHQKGVIHRDLKPSNILVDVEGVPRVLDFGLAKLVCGTGFSTGGPSDVMTMTGQVVGTLPYMSPEQTRGNPDEIDTRTDVYALGVVLYELLTGRYPYPVVGPMADVLRHIAHTEPTPPSRAWTPESGVLGGNCSSGISGIGSGAGSFLHRLRFRRGIDSPRRMASPIDDEVQTIVLKALAKEPERRYQSAGELARDIGNYLTGEPIEAKRDSMGYVFRKHLHRYRLAASVAVGFVLLLGASTIALSIMYRNQSRAREAAVFERTRAEQEAERARLAEAEQRRERERAEQSAAAEARQREKSEKVAEFMASVFAGVGPSRALGRDTTMLKELLDAGAKRIGDGELSQNPEAEIQLRVSLGGTYMEIAEYDAADRMLRPALELARRTLPAEHEMLAKAMFADAELLIIRGRASEALPKCEAALEMGQRLLPGDHPDVARGLNNVAFCLNSLGRTAEAMPKYEAALEMRQRLFNGDHPDLAVGLNNVAKCLLSLGRLAEALPKFEAALAMRQRLFNGDHPDVASGLNNAAFCLNSLGRSAEALPKFEAALAMRQRLFKSDHPNVASSLGNVASCLQSLDRSTEALPKFEAALVMRQRLFTGDHPDVAHGLNNVAFGLQSLGRSSEALSKFEAALVMWQRLLPGDHSSVALGLNNVAFCIQSLGRSEEALPKYEAALEMYQRLFKRDHPDVARGLINVASCLQSLGRSAEALPKFEAALEMYRRLFKSKSGPGGGGHPHLALSLNAVAICLQSLGRSAEALPKFEAALEMQRKLLPAGHVDIQVSRAGVGSALVDLNRYDEAEPLLLEAQPALEKSPGVAPRHKQRYMEALVKLYENWDGAEPNKGYDAKAAKWREKLAAWQATTQPAATMPTRSR